MAIVQNESIPLIIAIGEMRDQRVIFGNSFDPEYSYTEGQFRALYMRLQRQISKLQSLDNQVLEWENGKHIFITTNNTSGKKLIYCVIQKGVFADNLVKNITAVVERGGIYTAKKFYSEITNLQSGSFNTSHLDLMTPDEAAHILRNKTPTNNNILELTSLLVIIANSNRVPETVIFSKTIQTLDTYLPNPKNNQFLDAAFSIASQFYIHNKKEFAKDLYVKIAQNAAKAERLALEITCRLKAAELIRQLTGNAKIILEILSPIDDGSLEVATQEEREHYYSIQGYCFAQLEEQKLALDFHSMAVMISEVETSPSIHIAESHAYLGFVASKRFQPEIATREFLTAAAIAKTREDPYLQSKYTHKASIQEIEWSRHLASAAIIANIDNQTSDAEFYAWQALKRLINSIGHADKSRRKLDISHGADLIIDMTRGILLQTNSEYTVQTINELENQINFFMEGVLPSDQEGEMLNFMSSKISAMLPLPPPVILLIANDGRLIAGGKIGAHTWNESVMVNDDLFSGALSAIMAILSEVISDDNPLRMLDAGQTQIMIEKSSVCIGALLVDRDLNIIRRALRRTVRYMESTYPELEGWDGYSIDFSEVKPRVEEIFSEAMDLVNS